MKIQLKPIKPKLISDQVFDQLKDLIFRGEIKPGEKLMPERELAAALGVSRPTIREAIHKLVVMGLLEQRQGQGTFVRTPDDKEKNLLAMAMEAEDATLVDLLEVRMGLECNAVAWAAMRAIDEDIQRLKTQLDEMKKEVAAGKLGTEADVSFHMAISYATKNPMQIYLMRNLYDFLFVGIKENLRYLYEKPGNLDKIVAQHTRIYHAVRKHDPDEAMEAMKAHIQFVLDFFNQLDR